MGGWSTHYVTRHRGHSSINPPVYPASGLGPPLAGTADRAFARARNPAAWSQVCLREGSARQRAFKLQFRMRLPVALRQQRQRPRDVATRWIRPKCPWLLNVARQQIPPNTTVRKPTAKVHSPRGQDANHTRRGRHVPRSAGKPSLRENENCTLPTFEMCVQEVIAGPRWQAPRRAARQPGGGRKRVDY